VTILEAMLFAWFGMVAAGILVEAIRWWLR
jgi:hypothetical protein